MKAKVYGEGRQVVASNRVRIPSDYCEFVSDGVYAAPGENGCFLLIPTENVDTVLAKYNKTDPYLDQTEDMKEFSRRIHRQMFKPTIDSQFRMTITDNMKKLCKGIENAVEIVFGGEGDYLEVWPAHVYDKRYGEAEEDDFDTMIAILRAKLNK